MSCLWNPVVFKVFEPKNICALLPYETSRNSFTFYINTTKMKFFVLLVRRNVELAMDFEKNSNIFFLVDFSKSPSGENFCKTSKCLTIWSGFEICYKPKLLLTATFAFYVENCYYDKEIPIFFRKSYECHSILQRMQKYHKKFRNSTNR